MIENASESTSIGIEMIMLAAVITVIVTFANISHTLFNNYDQSKLVSEYMDQYTEVYMYDSTEVSWADIMDVISTYARVYVFKIELSDGTSVTISYRMEALKDANYVEYGTRLWKEETIAELLGGDYSRYIAIRFSSELIKDPDNGLIMGIKFKEV